MGVFINKDRNHVASNVTLTNNVIENAEASIMYDLTRYDERGFDIMQELATAIYISTMDDNADIVTEGINDFLSSAANFFKELIIRIGKFFKDVITYLTSYITNFESFVERNRERFLEAGTVRVKGYRYSLDQDKIPNTEIIDKIVNEFNRDISRMEEMSFEEVREKMDKYNLEEGSNIIRAAIVGASSPIEQSDVANHMKKLFRSGEDEPEYLDIDGSQIAQIASDYKSFRNQVKKVRKEQIIIEHMLGNVRSTFKKGPRFEYSGTSKKLQARKLEKDDKGIYRTGDNVTIKNSIDVTRVANLYYSFRFSQLKDLTNTIVSAASARTNAYKEQLKQNERILRKAIFGGEKDED